MYIILQLKNCRQFLEFDFFDKKNEQKKIFESVIKNPNSYDATSSAASFTWM